MESEIKCRIVLENPTTGVVVGLQQGSGHNYLTLQKQRSQGQSLVFEFKLKVKSATEEAPVFLGPMAQGPPHERFVYLDIGTAAGQMDSIWSRRLKIPLKSITWAMVNQCLDDPDTVLETLVPGTGKDGSPNCGTVKPFNGWRTAGPVAP